VKTRAKIYYGIQESLFTIYKEYLIKQYKIVGSYAYKINSIRKIKSLYLPSYS